VSAAIRRASRSHRDGDGRSTSVGHETGADDRLKCLYLPSALLPHGKVSLDRRDFARWKGLQGVLEHQIQVVVLVVACSRTHRNFNEHIAERGLAVMPALVRLSPRIHRPEP